MAFSSAGTEIASLGADWSGSAHKPSRRCINDSAVNFIKS
jgi:hypothetical protein